MYTGALSLFTCIESLSVLLSIRRIDWVVLLQQEWPYRTQSCLTIYETGVGLVGVSQD